MTSTDVVAHQAASPGDPPDAGGTRAPGGGRARDRNLSRFSGIVVLLALIVLYSLLKPDSFFTVVNLRAILSGEAVTGILAMGLIMALIVGMFDVSIAANMSWAIMFVAWLQATAHVPAGLAIVLTLLSGALIGVVNATLVTRLRIDPVIATLAMSSILTALTFWISDGSTIIRGISGSFKKIGTEKLFTLPLPIYYFAIIALACWYVLEHTTTGRYLYAAGWNPDAARLAGINVPRYQYLGFIASGVVGSFAGVVFTARIGAASYNAGAPYLLSSFASVFLGATQIRKGRFNVAGTVVAIFLLAVTIKGLSLLYPGLPWLRDLFQGVMLIIAVGFAARSRMRRTAV